MKKIGFVDYYLSEWHANNYPAWIKKVCAEAGLDFEVSYAYAEQDISPVDGRSTAEWCAAFGVQQCATINELCEKADVIVILAPSDPEKHLAYAEAVFPFGKPVYVDKTFAPDFETANKIVALAQKYATPFFSTSALRYDEALDTLENCRHMTVFGSGSSLEEYIVHPIEMVVKTLGPGAARVLCAENGGTRFFHIAYNDGRSATVVFAAFGLPGVSILQNGEGTGKTVAAKGNVFLSLMRDMLRFFADGQPSFDVAQTLEVMKIRDAVQKAVQAPLQWINI